MPGSREQDQSNPSEFGSFRFSPSRPVNTVPASELEPMSILDRLEERFGHLAIPHLLRYVAILNGLVFVLQKLNPNYVRHLTLDPAAVLEGQVWRLISHIFVPHIGSFFPSWIEALFYVLFLSWLGQGLESAMGAFRLNLYYGLGVVGTTASAFLAGSADGGFLLNNSLLFAFARLFPDLTIYLFLLIPIQVRWLALIDAVLVLLFFLQSGWSHRIGILASLANFALFFGPGLIGSLRTKRRKAPPTAPQAEGSAEVGQEPLHRCEVCGRTELTDPDLDFRVARDGQEYCIRHLPLS
jgi:hypothetical protein